MSKAKQLILSKFDTIVEKDLYKPIIELGVDSIDFVMLRVELDRLYNKEIPDSIWLKIDSFENLIAFYESASSALTTTNKSAKRQEFSNSVYKINMPQMAVGGLSENWLFKELGDVHWDMLTSGLGVPSYDLIDDLGNRLYATFVRFRYSSKNSFKQFKENETLSKSSSMNRFGESMYFSNHNISNERQSLDINLMTTFATRGNDNTKLTKGKPGGILLNGIEEVYNFPLFGSEYKSLRKEELSNLRFGNYEFKFDSNVEFETDYFLNPYLDLNGVNLLYFAAYPVISDYCESIYMDSINMLEKGNYWAQSAYTVFKDVFYFNNCNITDTVVYRLNSVVRINKNHIQTISTLIRKSDNTKMAKILAVKRIEESN